MSIGSTVKTGLIPRALAMPRRAAVVGAEKARMPFVDAIRATAAFVILGHHFSSYPPLATAAMPIAGPALNWLHDHGRVAQIFIVVSGFILASSMSKRVWDRHSVRQFVAQRYCRLAIPYLAAAGIAMCACAFARDWIDDSVIGSVPTIEQLAAHLVFMQDILGYESLSAGLWFVCISFQLTAIYLAGLFLRDAIVHRTSRAVRKRWGWVPNALAWLLSLASLFYFNRNDAWEGWAIFFFGQFFLGVLVHHALEDRRAEKSLLAYFLVIGVALAVDWRPRLVLALATGLMLYASGKIGVLGRWPTSRVVAFFGRISYSLFLIHFPVLVFVAAIWVQHDWTSPEAAMAGLIVAGALSVCAATLFYRFVEEPSMRLSRRFA
jgi:peptidoglycan/LPS O-acetylase OafA/YrhL